MKRLAMYRLTLILLLVLSTGIAAADDAPLPSAMQSFFRKHCLRCHGPDKQEGKLRIDTLDPLDAGNDVEHWQTILDRLNLQEMPPEDEPQPSKAESEAARRWLTDSIKAAIARTARAEVVLRRLNRNEYDNTIRDLFGLTAFEGSRHLPEDDSDHGFDNNAEALVVSPLLMETYLEAADEVLRFGLAGYLGKLPTPERVELDPIDLATPKWKEPIVLPPTYRVVDGHLAFVTDRNPIRTPGIRPFPVNMEGLYRLRVRAHALRHTRGSALLGIDGGIVDNGKPARFNLGAHAIPNDRSVIVEVEQLLRPGETFRLRYINCDNEMPVLGGGDKARPNPKFVFEESSALIIESLEIEGPLYFSDRDRKRPLVLPENPEAAGLETVLSEFAAKAYRRPLAAGDLDTILALAKEAEVRDGFKEAVRVGLKAILCSPKFLFLEEPGETLDDYAIATRMSYFLWSSMPDSRLFELASQGKLGDPAVRAAEVRRMITDPKSQALAENFAGQWLQVRKVGENRPDEILYPEYNEWLEHDMIAEPLAFFGAVLHDPSLPVTTLLDAEFAMLNESLAELYDVRGVTGSQLRHVALPADSPRGGVLGMASIHTVTSNGTVSSPVVRGAWLLENILGTPPPPPPPDVPAIESDISGLTTIREQLAKHREIESCASCHTRIDPLGFALENFDVMGRWRTHYRARKENARPGARRQQWLDGLPVETQSELPGGTELTGVPSLKAYLKQRQKLFATCLTEKLMVYALGRSLAVADRPARDDIVAQIEARTFEYPLQELLTNIVNSKPFLSP